MSLGESISPFARHERSVGTFGIRASVMLPAALVGSFFGYLVFFAVLHLRAVGWAPGQVLDDLPAYWSWFHATIFSAEWVNAARTSDLAARFPLLLIAAYVPISVGYLLIITAIRALAPAQQPGLKTLLAAAVMFSIPLILLPNILSSDVYSYISFGRIAAVWNGNPFTDPPMRFPDDPYLQWVYWSDVPSVYGPPWVYLSMLVTGIVEYTWSSTTAYVLAYKIAVALLHLVNGALVWAILSRWQPERRSWGTAFYLLNPLALVEFSGNAHNDVLMITFVLLGIWFHLHDLWSWTAVAWTVAVLAKWIALPLLPLYGLVLLWQRTSWRTRVVRLVGLIGLFAATTALLYLPFWRGPQTLDVLFDAPPQRLMVNSIGDLIAFQIQYASFLKGRSPHPELGTWSSMPMTTMAPGIRATRERDLEGLEADDWRSEQRARLDRYNRQQHLLVTTIVREDKGLGSIFRAIGLVLVMLACLVGAAITRNLRTLLLALAWIFFVYVTVGSVWVWPWYATWFVALAALLDWRVTGRAAILLSLMVPIIYPLTPILPLSTPLEQARSLIAFGPAIVLAGYQLVRAILGWWRARRQRRALVASVTT